MTYIDNASLHVSELYPLIVYGTPPLMDLPPGAIIGSWAYSVPGKVRFILDRSLELSPGVLPADVARAWVRDAYKLPIKRRKNQMVRSYTVPLHARRGTYRDCIYLDIQAAYLKILQLGYDLEYVPGRYLGVDPLPVPDEISRNKFCYSISVAMSASIQSSLTVMGKEGLYERKAVNMFSNPCLYALAQDTLNAIGGDVLDSVGSDCHYANTDGYIINRKSEPLVREILSDWGFSCGVKADGDAKVFGVGSWMVGNERTKRRDQNGQDFTGPIMGKEGRVWLRKQFSVLTRVLGV